jgi:hypothetical protein
MPGSEVQDDVWASEMTVHGRRKISEAESVLCVSNIILYGNMKAHGKASEPV